MRYILLIFFRILPYCLAVNTLAQSSPKGTPTDSLAAVTTHYFVEARAEDVLIAQQMLDEIYELARDIFDARLQPTVPPYGDFWIDYPDSFWVNQTGSINWSGGARWNQIAGHQLYEFREQLVVSVTDYRMVIMMSSRTEVGIIWARHDEFDRRKMSLALYEFGKRSMIAGPSPERSVAELFRRTLSPHSITTPE
jgi:hypothetical protein